jgi:hypothetical protein
MMQKNIKKNYIKRRVCVLFSGTKKKGNTNLENIAHSSRKLFFFSQHPNRARKKTDLHFIIFNK